MQQISLFRNDIFSIRRWNLEFVSQLLNENIFVATLSVPSWKFIVKYFLEDKKIKEFEVLDYMGYVYLTKAIIKNIKDLVELIQSTW